MFARRQLALACALVAAACGDETAPIHGMDGGLAGSLPPFEALGDGMSPPVTSDPEREAQCGFLPVPPPEPDGATYCTADTRACVDACGPLEPGNIGCVFGCLGADASPPNGFFGDCASCALRLLVGCAQTRGCEAEYVAQRCCQVDCADGGCADPRCSAEEEAVNICVFTRAAVCLDLMSETYALCFGEAPAMDDAPEGDGP
ncbi:MAG: hypothetical protein AAF447_00035 [Myxococcota bacterium]